MKTSLRNAPRSREQLHAVEDEYQQVKTAQEALAGKFRVRSTERKPRAPSTGRAPRSGKRQEILNLVKLHPEGLTAEQVSEKLGITDQKGRQYVSSTLSTFKSKNQLVGGGRNMPYRPRSGEELA